MPRERNSFLQDVTTIVTHVRNILVLFFGWISVPVYSAESTVIEFRRDVQPIFQSSCSKCHGATKQLGGLRLDRSAGALAAGDSGKQAIVPKNVADSELLRRVRSTDSSERMPPKGEPLTVDQIRTLEAWIEQGAIWPMSEELDADRREMVVTEEDRQHWSFRPLRAEPPGPVNDKSWCRNPVDQFILEELESKQLRPNGPASRLRLIRRLYFDLVGLPPSPEAVAEFLSNPSVYATEELVDRLLASPHYGERWGRHWLDLARYADSDGLETDTDRPTAYHYRDFVIRAWNEDLPFKTFVKWQLAGDEYEPDNPSALAATGFLAAAPYQPLSVPMKEEKLRLRYNELDDMAATTASAFLALTLGCARCHDHKFDAIPTRDYYRLQCAFTTTVRENVLLATRNQVADFREADKQWRAKLLTAQKQRDDWFHVQQQKLQTKALSRRIDALSISEEEKKLLREQPESAGAKKLAKDHEKALKISDSEYVKAFDDVSLKTWNELQSAVDSIQNKPPPAPLSALAIVDSSADPEPTWLLDRGDFYSRRSLLQVGFLSVLTNGRRPEEYWSAALRAIPPGRSTGQRYALAEWITDVDQGAGALLARVIVNRVWQHHFGEGLCRTVSDFGVRGEVPTHPKLLEWLSAELVRENWSLKSLHRRILTSATYLQSSEFDEVRAELDPENRLLWRKRPQRLEAEILRDAILATSGTLNLHPFGPSFKSPIPQEAIQARNTKNPYPHDIGDTSATRRRTVYQFHKRLVQHPLLQAFDGPEALVTCGRRSNTTVAPQALALLNDSFVRDRSADFARSLLAKHPLSLESCINAAFQISLGRTSNEWETRTSLEFIQEQMKNRGVRANSSSSDDIRRAALTDFCQSLFSLNEFLYVD